jgi:hypothetical protein
LLRAWLEPRTLLLGVMVHGVALSEGIARRLARHSPWSTG